MGLILTLLIMLKPSYIGNCVTNGADYANDDRNALHCYALDNIVD